jgi:hypothetical protein
MASGVLKVHAGDFRSGRLLGEKLSMIGTGKWFPEKIPLSQLEAVKVASEEAVKRFGKTVGWGIAGGVLLGPVGLLAGLLEGGKGKNITFVCKLKDGRKFMATALSKVFIALSAAAFTRRHPALMLKQDATRPGTDENGFADKHGRQGNFTKFVYLALNWTFGIFLLLPPIRDFFIQGRARKYLTRPKLQ